MWRSAALYLGQCSNALYLEHPLDLKQCSTRSGTVQNCFCSIGALYLEHVALDLEQCSNTSRAVQHFIWSSAALDIFVKRAALDLQQRITSIEVMHLLHVKQCSTRSGEMRPKKLSRAALYLEQCSNLSGAMHHFILSRAELYMGQFSTFSEAGSTLFGAVQHFFCDCAAFYLGQCSTLSGALQHFI
jgi:hypothetical protein